MKCPKCQADLMIADRDRSNRKRKSFWTELFD